jgi:hypothetical protein
MTDTTRAVLLIADISGYTRFMRLHAIATSHSKQIIVRLLKALVARHRAPLRLAELEGDAVFLWGPLSTSPAGDGAAIARQMAEFFAAFRAEVDALGRMPVCVCEACLNVGQLRLKQVVHVGEVATERIDRFEKLFGVDVILVHRMLKNRVASDEYVLMTDDALAALGTPSGFAVGRPHIEVLDGVGDVSMVVFDVPAMDALIDAATEGPGRLETLGWKLGMHGRALVDMARGIGRRTDA